MEYARNIIFFLFEHEREGYIRHADCTVACEYFRAKCIIKSVL